MILFEVTGGQLKRTPEYDHSHATIVNGSIMNVYIYIYIIHTSVHYYIYYTTLVLDPTILYILSCIYSMFFHPLITS